MAEDVGTIGMAGMSGHKNVGRNTVGYARLTKALPVEQCCETFMCCQHISLKFSDLESGDLEIDANIETELKVVDFVLWKMCGKSNSR